MDRRETKRQVIALRTMLRSNDLSVDQRNAMSNHILDLRSKLDSAESHVNPAEIAQRREFLQKNKGMLEIFNTFWVILLGYTTDGFLSKEGYGKFHHAIDIALAGQATFLEVDQASVDADWTYDKLLYGSLNKVAFFDMLFEVIETWTEIVDPTYYAAFAWALLDSIADTAAHPPKLRPHREMRCITKVENEVQMIKNYVKNKKVRAALSIESDMMQRIPEVQKRLHDRKRGVDIDQAQLSMVEILSMQASNSVEFSDSDGESLNSVVSLHQQLMLQQQSLADDGDEREEDDIVMDDDIEDDEEEMDKFLGNTTDTAGAFAGGDLENGEEGNEDESRDGLGLDMTASMKLKDRRGSASGAASVGGAGRGGTGQRGPGVQAAQDSYRLRRSTASFMAYCTGRRETRMMLNGLLGGDTSSSISGSLTTSIGSSKMMDFSAAAMLPSSMASLSTDTDTSSAVSGIDIDSPRSQHSTMSNNVLHIPSPSSKRAQGASNPFGGAVGDKARFSQFLASGKRLGSFAREYLHTHQINSGLAIDPLTGGSETVNDAVNNEKVLAKAMKLTRNGGSAYTFSSSNLNLLASHPEHGQAAAGSPGDASALGKKNYKGGAHASSQASLLNSRSAAELGSASFGDLNLMGKSMYVPKVSAKNKGKYLYSPGQGKEIAAVRIDKSGLSSFPSFASMGIKSIETDDPADGAAEGTAVNHASTTIAEESGASAPDSPMDKAATISAKVSGKRGSDKTAGSENTATATVSTAEAATAAPGAAGAPAAAAAAGTASIVTQPAGEEFGEVVDDGTSKYFNVLDTQVTMGIPYYAPQVGNKQPAGRAPSKKATSVSDHGGRKEPIEGNRGPFLMVESQAPPIDPQKVITRVRPLQGPAATNNTGTTSSNGITSNPTSPTNGTRAIAYNDSQPPTARDNGVAPFTRTNTGEMTAPDVASVVMPLLSPAPRFDALFAQGYSHTGQLKVANITYPLNNTNLQQNNNNKNNRARANSNISYADSDVSLESIQHIKEMENVYSQYGDNRGPHGGMPTMHRRFQADASTSVETIFSDTMSSPPMSAVHPSGRYHSGAIPPSVVLDSSIATPSGSRQHRRGVDLERSGNLDSNSYNSQYPQIKRGTNLAILPPRQPQLAPKPDNSTFPQSMYYNVVKTALDIRQQPNFNPSWDHTRATKNVRLSALRNKPVDVSLSLTTAPMNISNATKLAEVIRDTDHQRRILSGAIDPKRMTTPTNSRKKAPLTINITSAGESKTQLGSVLENEISRSIEDAVREANSNGSGGGNGTGAVGGGSLTSGLSSTGSPSAFTRPSMLSQGSFNVPSITELKKGMLAANSLPAPDALLESLVQLRKPIMDDENEGAEVASYGTRGGGSSSVGSLASGGSNGRSIHSNGPHLLIKPILGVQSLSGSPVTVPGVNSRDSSPTRGSPDKSPPKNGHGNTYVDQQGKLRVKDVSFEKGMLQVLHDIDIEKNAGMCMATLESQHSLAANSAPLVPIKHPYLTMNGTKHVLPDKVLASLVYAQTRASQLETDGSQTDTLFLGNSSGMLIRDSTLSHTYEQTGGNIPWLPRGTLEPPEHDRSNQLIGKREKLDLQKHFSLDANRQVLTIRSQNAIRGAFEDYVHNKLKPQHRQPAPFNQLDRAQQEALLQQYNDRAPVLGGKPRVNS